MPVTLRTLLTPSPASSKPARNLTPKCSLTTDYPSIEDWLKALDSHLVHGKFKLNYTQYAPKLIENGLIDLGDLIGLSLSELQQVSGMNFGTARRVQELVVAKVRETEGDQSKKLRKI